MTQDNRASWSSDTQTPNPLSRPASHTPSATTHSQPPSNSQENHSHGLSQWTDSRQMAEKSGSHWRTQDRTRQRSQWVSRLLDSTWDRISSANSGTTGRISSPQTHGSDGMDMTTWAGKSTSRSRRKASPSSRKSRTTSTRIAAPVE